MSTIRSARKAAGSARPSWRRGALGVLALLFFVPSAAQALDVWAFISVGGQNLPGDGSQSNPLKRNGIQVSAVGEGIERVYDPISGIPGPPRPLPLTITKGFDAASPLLFQALVNSSVIDAEFRFFQPNAAGQDEHFYTIQISNGRITKALQSGGFTAPLESVEFNYQNISHTSVTGGTSGNF